MPEKDLKSKIEQLLLPKNFYAGYLHEKEMRIPDNILMFFRKGIFKTVTPNIHHRFLLFVNFKDPLSLIVDSRRFVIEKNHAMLVFPHQYHLFVYDGGADVERLLITFEGCDANEMQKLRGNVFRVGDKFFRFLEILTDEYLSGEIRNRKTGNNVSLFLKALLGELENCACYSGTFKSNDVPLQDMNTADRINSYIQNNLDTPLSVGQIAEFFKYSPSHLRLLYRNAMGISVGKYVRQTKIHKACGCLGHRIKISDIAASCGYSSIYAFSHAFKKEVGVYPGEYRKKHFK